MRGRGQGPDRAGRPDLPLCTTFHAGSRARPAGATDWTLSTRSRGGGCWLEWRVPSSPVPSSPAPPSPAPSPALAAFLRGIERRAYVFAWLQCGDAVEAEACLGRTLRAFRNVSAITTLSGWPAAFWSLLLAQAELSGGRSPEPELAALASGPRAALLLRLVGGLDFGHAAQVLGVAEETYRFALQRALQQLGDAGVSFATLGALRERLHRQVKTLPAERAEALAALRQRVLADQPDPLPSPPAPRRRLRITLWLALLALLAALAATWWWPGGTPAVPAAPTGLPAAAPVPAAPVAEDPGADAVMHPDFAQLVAAEDDVVARALPRLAWWLADSASGDAAGRPGVAASGPGATPPAAPAAEDLRRGGLPPMPAPAPAVAAFPDLPPAQRALLAPLATAWPGLDGDTRARLASHAAYWLALPPDQRERLQARMRDWDAQPPAVRAARRAPFLAWQALPASEQAQVRAAARRWDALDEATRAALSAAFDQLPATARDDWWLGPDIGRDFGALRPLFAYASEGERPAMLALVRSLDAATRADLAVLARRLPQSEREAFRRALAEAAPEARAALVRARLAQ